MFTKFPLLLTRKEQAVQSEPFTIDIVKRKAIIIFIFTKEALLYRQMNIQMVPLSLQELGTTKISTS